MVGKFDSDRDRLLYVMSLEGWANASSGSVECPTGFFARISNDAREIPEIRQAFPTETAGISNALIRGHFLCVEDSLGFWHVTRYETQRALERAYKALEAEYIEWLGDDG
jgi:hypothetical protein